jgi:acyl-lipid omega-6 desaturase (Delta-12 desaturase)
MDDIEYFSLREKAAKLRPNNLIASFHVMALFLVLGLGVLLSLQTETWVWILGQLIVGYSMWIAFVLAHDLGHNSFFSKRSVNRIFGSCVSLVCLMPFFTWVSVHENHHTWCGWQDKDLTTQSQVPSEKIVASKFSLLNIAWKFWIPVMSPAFALTNLWNLKKLDFHFSSVSEKNLHRFSLVLSVLIVGVGLAVFQMAYVKCVLLAQILFYFLSDPIVLSQHVHIPMQQSGGQRVRPFSTRFQDRFTRSLTYPSFISKFVLLNFDKHALHHMFPNVPCYFLHLLQGKTENKIDAFRWLKIAKAQPAKKLLFQDRNSTKLHI